MKKAKNELLQFLGGLVMLVVGLYIFSQKVMVTSDFFGGGHMMLGSLHINNGLIMIPFIIGIVWMFVTDGSFASKIMTGLGVLIIIVSIILSTNISLVRITLYEWVLILVLIFGGAGLITKLLLGGGKKTSLRGEGKCPQLEETEEKIRRIEREIDQMKREQ